MSKFMVIVESPAKSKTIYKILGKDYNIQASMGHVYNLPKKNLGIDIHKNFNPTYEVIPDRKKIVKDLKSKAKKAEKIFLATDLDREGEAIAAHLQTALNIPEEKTFRVIFNEITPTAIKKAFKEAGKISHSKVNAQKTRRILDRLVGYKISPLLWKKIMSGLSAGRVQSVALKVIAERELEIRAFKPEEYWELDANLLPSKGKKNDLFQAKLKKISKKNPKLTNEKATKKLMEEIQNLPFVVSKVLKKEKKSSPSPPFITSTLQQRASTNLYFNPKKTMTIAQQLYEGVELKEGSVGLITYMRTDSVNISKDAIKDVRDYIEKKLGEKYLPKKPIVYKSRSSAQEAHEAIRPTATFRNPEGIKPFLTKDQFRLYKLIWERFMASQMTSAVYDTTSIDISAGKAIFGVKGRILKFDGFLKIYQQEELGNDEKTKKEGEQNLPNIEEGEILKLKELLPSQHFTKPPSRYTEASIVRTLEKEGIGRPSTYAGILSNIQTRKYVEVKKRALHATDLGVLVIDRLTKHFSNIMDLKFTSRMEEKLDQIEAEELDWQKVLNDFYQTFIAELQEASEKMEGLNENPEVSEELCKKCKQPMNFLWKRDRREGIIRFMGCSAYPKCDHTKSVDGSTSSIEPEKTDFKCKKCKSVMLIRMGKNGKFLGCSKYPECSFTQTLDPEGKPIEVPKGQEKCEKCEKPMAVKHGRRGPFLACTGYPKCKNAKSLSGVKQEKQEIDLKCEKCEKPMAIKYSRRGPFVACTGYPDCKNTKPMSVVEDSSQGE